MAICDEHAPDISFYCTRGRGHDGQHVASDSSGAVLRTWSPGARVSDLFVAPDFSDPEAIERWLADGAVS